LEVDEDRDGVPRACTQKCFVNERLAVSPILADASNMAILIDAYGESVTKVMDNGEP
jgi:hypothetical protein